ncbi:MAG: oligoendopeptidase F [Clostridia bacterium]|nr:oligoendopeptidase F [Clostridia bacterium]
MKRSQIDNKYKWNIEEIFSSDKVFYKELSEFEKQIDFLKYKGKLNTVETLKKCLDELYLKASNLEVFAVYAMMKKDEDASNPLAIKLEGAISEVEVKFSMQTAFIDPELTALPIETLKEFSNDKCLSLYKRDIDKIIENKPHVLTEEVESVLAQGAKIFGGFKKIFSLIDDVDLDFPTIKVDGKKVKITGATYSLMLQHPDREVRKKAFKAYYKAYNKVLNTITAVYQGNLDKNVFFTRIRKFKSCLDKALFYEEVDKEVYLNLIDSVHTALPTLHRYIKDRKTVLGYDINMYDLYVPLVENADLKLDFEEAFDLVKEGLKPLGKGYLELLDKAKEERWMDVYENDGKRSGAYSVSVYNLKHPYVLLNHTKTTHSVFTIAHELGHAMHSYMSDKEQPITTADYKIFVAEVASTVNEVLLIKHLIATTKDLKIKKYLLSYYLDTIRTTLFRQTMFAEFEHKAHLKVEKGEALTKEDLNKIYLKLNKTYYGKDVKSDREISYEWARIPHFYSAFYVYKYATGIISAIAISERILSGEKGAVEDYFAFLSSGSSDKPVELLKIAGVDLTDKNTYIRAFNSFENALNEFEKLI